MRCASNENESASLKSCASDERAERKARARESARRSEFFLNLLPRRARANVSNFTRAKKETPPRNERDEIKRALLPPDFCPPDASLSFFSVSSGMNRFGVSVFRLLLRSVIVCVRLRFFVTNTCLLSKNTPKKQEIRESFVSTRAHTSSASRSKRA